MNKFYVYHEEYLGDEPKEFIAYDHEHAAELYGEDYDCQGDYELANGSTFEVVVKDRNGVSKSFRIYAEPRVDYIAREV